MLNQIRLGLNLRRLAVSDIGFLHRRLINTLNRVSVYKYVQVVYIQYMDVGNIKAWLEEGKEKNASHLIVICDTFDYSYYPVFVKRDESATQRVEAYRAKSMQKVMEVYSIDEDWGPQLKEEYNIRY